MRTKDPELMKQILEYIEDYYIDLQCFAVNDADSRAGEDRQRDRT